MYDNTNFRLALIPATSFEDSFKFSKEPLFKDIYDERIKPHLQEYADYPDHLTDMVHFIQNDFSTALIDSYIPITSSKAYQDCEIVVTDGKYFISPYAWMFPKNSPFLPIFNHYIREIIESGQWNAIVEKYSPPPQICPYTSGKPIEFANCFTAFLILCIGLTASLLALCAESIFQHMSSN